MGLDTKGFQPVELSQEELEKCEEVHDRSLLQERPCHILGNMATRMRVQNCDDWCPTAATDGRNLYYNTQFFNMLTNKQIEFVIAHEILHCVFDHIIRREDRNPRIFNIACDYKVNNLLVRDKIGERVDQIQIFQDFKYDDWTSEEIYDDIYNKYDEEELQALGELLDEHIDWEKDGNKEGEGKNPGKGGGKEKDKKSKRPSYSKEELKKIRDEIKESMITSAQSAGAGNTPGEIARMIKELTEPKMNWRELLRQQIQSTIKSDFTFSRPARKGWHTGAVLPGMNFMDTIDICIGIDMSGSIGNSQAQDFLGEVKGIMDEYKDYKIKLWCFDTQVYNEEDFSADGGKDLLDYEILGGGGTDFEANWEYMKFNDIQPKKFIMFTDGYPFGSWGDEDYCDTIFVIHSNRDKTLQAPFGVTAHYEESA